MRGKPVDIGIWYPEFFKGLTDAWQKDRLNLLLVWLDSFAKKIESLKGESDEKTRLNALYKQLTALVTEKNIADFNQLITSFLTDLSKEQQTTFLKDASDRLTALKPILIAEEKDLTSTERQFAHHIVLNEAEEEMVSAFKIDGGGPGPTRIFTNLTVEDLSWDWIKKAIKQSLDNETAMQCFVTCGVIHACEILFNPDGSLKPNIFAILNASDRFNELMNKKKPKAANWNLANFLSEYIANTLSYQVDGNTELGITFTYRVKILVIKYIDQIFNLPQTADVTQTADVSLTTVPKKTPQQIIQELSTLFIQNVLPYLTTLSEEKHINLRDNESKLEKARGDLNQEITAMSYTTTMSYLNNPRYLVKSNIMQGKASIIDLAQYSQQVFTAQALENYQTILADLHNQMLSSASHIADEVGKLCNVSGFTVCLEKQKNELDGTLGKLKTIQHISLDSLITHINDLTKDTNQIQKPQDQARSTVDVSTSLLSESTDQKETSYDRFISVVKQVSTLVNDTAIISNIEKSNYRQLKVDKRVRLALDTESSAFAKRALRTSFLGHLFGRSTSRKLTADQLIDLLEQFGHNKEVVDEILKDRGLFGGQNFWQKIRDNNQALLRVSDLSKNYDEIKEAITRNNKLYIAMRKAVFDNVPNYKPEYYSPMLIYKKDLIQLLSDNAGNELVIDEILGTNGGQNYWKKIIKDPAALDRLSKLYGDHPQIKEAITKNSRLYIAMREHVFDVVKTSKFPNVKKLTAEQLVTLLQNYSDQELVLEEILMDKGRFGHNYWKQIRDDHHALLQLRDLISNNKVKRAIEKYYFLGFHYNKFIEKRRAAFNDNLQILLAAADTVVTTIPDKLKAEFKSQLKEVNAEAFFKKLNIPNLFNILRRFDFTLNDFFGEHADYKNLQSLIFNNLLEYSEKNQLNNEEKSFLSQYLKNTKLTPDLQGEKLLKVLCGAGLFLDDLLTKDSPYTHLIPRLPAGTIEIPKDRKLSDLPDALQNLFMLSNEKFKNEVTNPKSFVNKIKKVDGIRLRLEWSVLDLLHQNVLSSDQSVFILNDIDSNPFELETMNTFMKHYAVFCLQLKRVITFEDYKNYKTRIFSDRLKRGIFTQAALDNQIEDEWNYYRQFVDQTQLNAAISRERYPSLCDNFSAIHEARQTQLQAHQARLQELASSSSDLTKLSERSIEIPKNMKLPNELQDLFKLPEDEYQAAINDPKSLLNKILKTDRDRLRLETLAELSSGLILSFAEDSIELPKNVTFSALPDKLKKLFQLPEDKYQKEVQNDNSLLSKIKSLDRDKMRFRKEFFLLENARRRIAPSDTSVFVSTMLKLTPDHQAEFLVMLTFMRLLNESTQVVTKEQYTKYKKDNFYSLSHDALEKDIHADWEYYKQVIGKLDTERLTNIINNCKFNCKFNLDSINRIVEMSTVIDETDKVALKSAIKATLDIVDGKDPLLVFEPIIASLKKKYKHETGAKLDIHTRRLSGEFPYIPPQEPVPGEEDRKKEKGKQSPLLSEGLKLK